MTSTLAGRVTLCVSTPAGQCCTIAALTSGRVDQLHGAIERALKIPRLVQRLICGGKEIFSQESVAELQLENGSQITVINSWPQDPELIAEKLQLAASTTATHALAAAVATCLAHEDGSVQAAALNTLSWMGRIAAPHIAAIARLLRDGERGVPLAAAESLSWFEEGAVYAADILRYACAPSVYSQTLRITGKAVKAVKSFFESDSSSTRLAATKSVIGLLEDDSPVAPDMKAQRERIILPQLCQGLFDPSEEVRRAAAAYLTSCIPTCEAEAEPEDSLAEELICQLLLLGEGLNLEGQHDAGIAQACQDISRRLDSHWAEWAGWQEGLDDPDTSAEAATCQVSVAMVYYLRRRFCEWQHSLSQAQLAELRAAERRDQLGSLRDLLGSMVEKGLSSRKWQVRHAVVESFLSLEPWGLNVVRVINNLQGHEKDKSVKEVMTKFFAKYGSGLEDSPQLFEYYYNDAEWVSVDSDESEEHRIHNLEEEEDFQLRDKAGGYSKSHQSRSARHNNKHGVASAAAPSTIARKKKSERRTRPEEKQDFAESKRTNQRGKEEDRHFKTAMLGHQLLRFAFDDA
ncbi:unnamed protein product [Effrenium voratum]|uniref:Ubiquitin-like domain-containing protein n=1 Tax=Effrenium voratum TaxID=2562239 RepID=A0AA36HSU5_9DINO|nr:unnamed protein product [Effrenium voratum]